MTSDDSTLFIDANIVATMRAHGVQRLLTHNTDDFARYNHLITIVPLERPTPASNAGQTA
jgi:predicted nucleic acid-binding protein